MNMEGLVLKTRSCRRFYEDYVIGSEVLRGLVDLARLSASGANLQPLKYMLYNQKEKNALIFSKLGWAGYLQDWPGPSAGERPSAYIIVLGDQTITTNFGCDHGIASQSILLGATSLGLAGCIIASVKRDQLRKELSIPDHLEILHVIALGRPKEQIVIDPLGPDGDIKYRRDKDNVHHVPKRALDELILTLRI
jgi:nitroreductase